MSAVTAPPVTRLRSNTTRLETARRWLVDSPVPIEKIARHTGFSGPDPFTLVFRKAVAISLSAYRKIVHNDARLRRELGTTQSR